MEVWKFRGLVFPVAPPVIPWHVADVPAGAGAIGSLEVWRLGGLAFLVQRFLFVARKGVLFSVL